jgi:hypothetical protein
VAGERKAEENNRRGGARAAVITMIVVREETIVTGLARKACDGYSMTSLCFTTGLESTYLGAFSTLRHCIGRLCPSSHSVGPLRLPLERDFT